METIFHSKTYLRDVEKSLRLSLHNCERKGKLCETAAKKLGPGTIHKDQNSVELIGPIAALNLGFMQSNLTSI